jgi:hypothetical protein
MAGSHAEQPASLTTPAIGRAPRQVLLIVELWQRENLS